MPETLTDAQKVLRNDTGKRIAVALEALASEVEPSTVIAPEYDATQTYAVGDLVIYRSVLYRCTTAIITPEEWTAAHWSAVTVADELADKYEKPTGGIPKNDLAANVQTSLDKADSALQSVPSTYRTAAAQDVIDSGINSAITNVQKQITANVQTSTTASKAYAVGEYLVLNGVLYRVTATISNGGTITPNTNVVATTATRENYYTTGDVLSFDVGYLTPCAGYGATANILRFCIPLEKSIRPTITWTDYKNKIVMGGNNPRFQAIFADGTSTNFAITDIEIFAVISNELGLGIQLTSTNTHNTGICIVRFPDVFNITL